MSADLAKLAVDRTWDINEVSWAQWGEAMIAILHMAPDPAGATYADLIKSVEAQDDITRTVNATQKDANSILIESNTLLELRRRITAQTPVTKICAPVVLKLLKSVMN